MSRSTVERQWTAHGLDCAVLWIAMSMGGHRCGYVRVPESHPWYGLSYNDEAPQGAADYADRDIDDAGMAGMISVLGGQRTIDSWARRVEAHVAVHGGLTYAGNLRGAGLSDGWWFGFDCAHLDDSPERWTEDAVAAETERMAEQIAAAGRVTT